MAIRLLLFLALLTPVFEPAPETEIDAIGEVLDDFHDAAAHGDKARFLGHMTDDAVFMGTDEWERWPKYPELTDYVSGRFQNGSGWSYRSVERHVQIAEPGENAWFDEVAFSETNGRFRGTGVLTRQDGQWKIAHYAMSFLILNENWTDVIELTKRTREQKR
jgi:ketosteroid isomerase-like protein